MKKLLTSAAEKLLELSADRWILFAAIGWLLALAGLRPLMLPDEGRYVGVAWEMLSGGSWTTPLLDGMPFFHKPPLFYWLTMLGMQLFGANEWAARIASSGAAVVAALALFAFVRKHVGRAEAKLSIVVLVTQPFFFAAAQYANLDMLVASMISITILAGADAVLSMEQGLPHRRSLFVCYVFAALGVLAKGLIGFVLPGAIIFAWLVVRRQFRLIPVMLPLSHIALFVLIALPWFLWMQHTYPGFWDYFFVYHHFRRFAETGFNNQQPFWFYVPVLLLFTLPWSAWAWRVASPKFLADSGKVAVRSLMVLWLLGIVAFFSLPKSKLVGYILPALAPFAYLVADVAVSRYRQANARKAPWLGLAIVLAPLLCIASIAAALSYTRSVSGLNQFAAGDHGFKADDQVVMLYDYAYDLPFYLKARKSAWVVDDWTSKPDKDNWHKEVYDAGLFNPETMSRNLISADEFLARLCAADGQTFWIWGKQSYAARYAFLTETSQVFASRGQALWRVDPAALQALRPCGGKPSNG